MSKKAGKLFIASHWVPKIPHRTLNLPLLDGTANVLLICMSHQRTNDCYTNTGAFYKWNWPFERNKRERQLALGGSTGKYNYITIILHNQKYTKYMVDFSFQGCKTAKKRCG